jgi:hypothetical protein
MTDLADDGVSSFRNRTIAATMRFVVLVCLYVVALLCGGSDAAASTQRSLRSAVNSTNTSKPTVPHVSTDENGTVWHVLNGSHGGEDKPPAVIPSNSTTLPVQLDIKEHSDSSSKMPTAPAHHKTPMMGFVIIGAMAILCVGIAASIANRRKAKADGDDGSYH